jgi:hypothetical protein
VDQVIFDLLARAVRVGEREYEARRTEAAAKLLVSLRRALADAEVYQTGRGQSL